MSGTEQLWDWRQFFTCSNLNLGLRDYNAGKIGSIVIGEDGRSAKGVTENGFIPEVKSIPTNYEEYRQYPRWDQLLLGRYYDGPKSFKNYYGCTCSQGINGTRCRHLVNLLLRWEEIHGPFTIYESEEDRAARLKREWEEKEKARKQQIKRKAVDCFNALDVQRGKLHFDPDAILENSEFETDQYEVEESKRLLAENPDAQIQLGLTYDRKDEQNLNASLSLEGETARITCDREYITNMTCSCGRGRQSIYWYGHNGGKLCAHALALWSLMRQRIARENPGDNTDAQANKLLTLMASGPKREAAEEATPARPSKRQTIALQPRIVRDRNKPADLKLGFDIGYAGSRLYAVKSLSSLVKAVDEQTTYKLSAKSDVNFAEEDFNEDARRWYALVTARVRQMNRVNERLQQSYYIRPISAGEGIPLEDTDLDRVYDMTKGGEILYQYGTRTEVTPVPVGRAKPRAEVTVDPIGKKKLTGIQISGSMPRMLTGSQRQYILDRTCFGQVEDSELSILEPFRAIADVNGDFRCTIGDKKFAEFYYRVLPKLQDAGQIVLTDNVSSRLETLVPPEPEFTFSDAHITMPAFLRQTLLRLSGSVQSIRLGNTTLTRIGPSSKSGRRQSS